MPELIGTAVIALLLGVLIGRFLLKKLFKQQEDEARLRAEMITREAEIQAENSKKEKMMEAKEHFMKLKSEFENDANKKKNILITNENKLKQNETKLKQIEVKLKQKEDELKKTQDDLTLKNAEIIKAKDVLHTQKEVVSNKIAETEEIKKEQLLLLEKISNLKAEEAKEQLIASIQEEAQTKASSLVKQIVEEAKLTATKEAKKIVINTIQRTATEHAIENCVSVFNLESDELKGKIIGREGRNIRALESATGVEIIVDDTPEAIII
jgi:ribonuclease Y